MWFSTPVVDCLIKKAYNWGSHGHPRNPPSYTPAHISLIPKVTSLKICLEAGGGTSLHGLYVVPKGMVFEQFWSEIEGIALGQFGLQ